MNVLALYYRIQTIGKQYIGQGPYSKGFHDCLVLFKIAFKKEPSINLHIENHKLTKRVVELEAELDDKDYDLLTARDIIQQLKEKISNLEGGKLTVDNCKTIKLRKNLVVQTGAPKEKVEQIYNECLQTIQRIPCNKKSRKVIFNYLQENLKEQGYEIARTN